MFIDRIPILASGLRLATAVAALTGLFTQSCTGKVANLNAAQPAIVGISIQSDSLYGIQVGDVQTGISTIGGVPPLRFSIDSGELPTGLTLNQSTGEISGTIPTSQANKEYLVTITVTDSAELSATKVFQGTVDPGTSILSVKTKSIATFVQGVNYQFPFLVVGGKSPYKFSVYAGSLPNGIVLDAKTGVLSGAPAVGTADSQYAFGVEVEDSEGQKQRSDMFLGTVSAGSASPVKIVSTSISGVAVGDVITGISVAGGVPPLKFAISNGALPAGLSIDTTSGAITGSISVTEANKTYAVAITVSDANKTSDIKTFTGSVAPGSSLLDLASSTLSAFTAGIPYSFPMVATGGNAPYTFAVSTGSLPDGLSLNTTTGVISGTPLITSGGLPYGFGVSVTDASSQSKSRSFSGVIAKNPAGAVKIVTTSLPTLNVGSVSTGISTAGGLAPLKFEVASGALPAGVILNADTGALTGTISIVSAQTSYGVTISVTDASGSSDLKSYSGTVGAGSALLNFVSSSLANFTAGISYSYPLVVTGGFAPFNFTITSGALPNGISIDAATGILSGTPVVTSGGTSYSFSVSVADSASQSQTKQFSGTIGQNPAANVKIVSTNVPGIAVGPVSTGVSTSGGLAPLTFSISSGSLPTGLTLNTETGAITGTIGVASAGASFGFSILVKDAANSTDMKSFTGSIDAGNAVLSLASSSIANFTAGIPYSYPLIVTGGASPFTFATSSGALPAGITLNTSTGVISGTPTLTSGGQTYNFTISVTDDSGQTKSKSFSGSVAANPAGVVKIVSTSLPSLSVGTVSSGISTSGGIAPLTFAVASGSLPSGVTLDPTTGALTGTIPVSSAGASYAVSISVTDSSGSSDVKPFSGMVGSGASVLNFLTNTLSSFTAGISYLYPLTVSGGIAPFNYSVSSGALPSGVSLNTSTGVLSGTPLLTSGGSAYSFTITVTDSVAQTQSKQFSGTVAANPASNINIVSTSLPGIAVGPVSTLISTSGGIAPFTFSIVSGALPAGLTLNTSTGAITGTITVLSANTSYGVSIKVTDASNSSDTESFSGSVAAGSSVLAFITSSLSSPTAGINYSYPLVVSGGASPYTFSTSGGALPSGLSIDSATGVISGTPSVTSGGTNFSVTISVSDSQSQTQSRTFTGTVGSNPAATVKIVSSSLPSMAVGSVSSGVSTSGGLAPLTFAVASGALPQGLTLNTSTGAITGTIPVAAANSSYAVSISVTDASGSTDVKAFSGNVGAGTSVLALLTTSIANFTAGINYSYPLIISGGVSPFTYSISNGNLPSGVSINTTTGLISGTPSITSGGQAYNFTVTVTDSASQTQSRPFSGTIAANPAASVSIVSSSILGISVGNVSTGISTSGGIAPLSFAITSGSLPTGLTLDSATGAITGTIPISAAGDSYGVGITVTDASNAKDVKTFTGSVAAGNSILNFVTTSLSQFTAGIAYNYPLIVTGGSAPFTFSVSTGTLPTGISIDSATGAISGTPAVNSGGQNFSFSISVSDSSGQTKAKAFTGSIASNPASVVKILSTSLASLNVGSVASGISTSGGIAPLTFAIASGSLPTGVSLNTSTGALTGTIPVASSGASYAVSISVTDSSGSSDTKAFSGTVGAGSSALSLLSTSISTFTAGISYSYPLIISGGVSPFEYSISNGTLPSGVSLNTTTGLISGTPLITSGGQAYNFTVSVTDSASQTQSRPFSGTIAANPAASVSITSTSILGITVGTVSTGISTSGGIAPLSFAITSGSLPTGLSLNSTTGAITGTIAVANAGESYGVGITVTDASNAKDVKTFTGTVNAGNSVLALATTSLSPFTAGIAYTYPLMVSGGLAPFTFAVSSGNLPTGISLDTSTGVISGTPAVNSGGQTYSFSLSVTDSSSQTKVRAFTGSITSNPAGVVKILTSSLTSLNVGSVSSGISTSGGIAPLTFAIASGTLPTGVTLDTSTGAITGTIPVASSGSSYAVTISVTDASGSSDTKAYSGTVSAGSSALALLSTSIANFTAGISYSYPMIISGGVSPFTYSVSSGTLPSGVSLNTTTGLLTGTPLITSGGQPYSFTITVTDSAAQTQSRPFSGTIAANPAASVSITSTTIPGISVGTVTTGISTSGGIAPLTFAITSGSLPTGLTLDTATGAITGSIAVSAAGTSYGVGITVTDASNAKDVKTFTGAVSAGNSVLNLVTTSLSQFTAGISYNFPLITTGGTAPFSFTISTGSLPTGVNIDASTGILSGTPAVNSGGQTYSFTVTVTDAASQTQSRLFLGSVATNPAAAVQIVSSALGGISVGSVTSGVSVIGGIAPLSFSITGGALPSGLSINASTGVISGTIPVSAANNSYAVTIQVTDASGSTASKTFSGSIGAGTAVLVFNSTTISPFIAGIAYSYPLVASNGVPPYNFAVTTGALPSGVTLNTSTGVISGTPALSTSGQSYGFTLAVTDSASQMKSQSFIGSVMSSSVANLQITTTSFAAPTAGTPYAAGISVAGGTSPFTFSVSSGNLPSGLTLNQNTGVISGTVPFASRAASYLFGVTVTDNAGLTATAAFNGTIDTYTTSLMPTTFPAASPGQGYSAYVATIGGQAPYTYTITAGSLPSGLSLNSNSGVISGIVSENEAGLTKNFTLRTTDANNVVSTASVALMTTAYSVTISTTALSNAVEGSTYNNGSVNLAATGGTGSYTYEFSGSLPTGVGLTTNGSFFGTAASGSGSLSGGTTYTINVKARDSNNNVSKTVSLNLTVIISSPVVDSIQPTNAIIGGNYSHTITATGGRPPYTFARTGSLPQGLTLGSSGAITGSASASSSCPAGNFTVTATDSLSQVSAGVVKCIATVTGVGITSSAFNPIIRNASYSGVVTAAGGTPPYTFSATGLPTNIFVSSGGALSGVTNVDAGTFPVTFSVTDSSTPPQSSSRSYTLAVRDAIALTGATMTRGATGRIYGASGAGYQINASGGLAPYTYVITSGSLPTGLSMSSAGLVSGTPSFNTAANGGTYSISVVATDAEGQSTSPATFTMTVSIPPKITETAMPFAVAGVPYSYDLKRFGGYNDFKSTADQSTNITWSTNAAGTSALSSAGLTFDTVRGRIFGSSPVAGSYSFPVTVTDGYGFSGSATLSLNVNPAGSGKTLELKTARYSDPCGGNNTQCNPIASDIAKLTESTTWVNGVLTPNNVNTQQFLISLRNDNPRSIQIAKVDPTGRIPRTGNFIRTVPLNTFPVWGINYIKTADIDQDGYTDIVFSDGNWNGSSRTSQVCVLWNGGTGGVVTQDQFGMPTAFSANNMDCFGIPNYYYNWVWGGTQNTQGLLIRHDLRPDATNFGKQDVVLTSSSSNAGNVAALWVLRNTCPMNGACTASRSIIFEGYTAFTNVTTTASMTINLTGATTVNTGAATVAADGWRLAQNAIITGPNIHPSSLVSSAAANSLSFTVGTPNNWNLGAGTNKIIVSSAMPGSSLTGSITNGVNTITNVSNTSTIIPGQMIVGTGIPTATRVISISGTTITMSGNATATATNQQVQFVGPTSMPIWLGAASGARDLSPQVGLAWLISPKPNLPSVRASVTTDCPSLVVGGQRTDNGWQYIANYRQAMSGGQCLGDFQTHSSVAGVDEILLSTSNPNGWGGHIAGILAEDFTGDGLTEIVATTHTGGIYSNSANVRIFIPQGSSNNAMTGTNINPQLQSRGTAVVGADRVAAYCIDGSTTCAFPSLVVTNSISGSTGQTGGLSILPNQCSSTPCTNPFEPTTPNARIDYPGPTSYGSNVVTANQNNDLILKPLVSTSNITLSCSTQASSAILNCASDTTSLPIGQPITGNNIPSFAYVRAVSGSSITMNLNAIATSASNVTVTVPSVPTRLDIAMTGQDSATGSPYFMTYARNGASTTDPLKASQMLDSMPAGFLQFTDVGAMRLFDNNSDGKLDLFAYLPAAGAVNSYVSSSLGGVSYNVGASVPGNYLANFNSNGCPSNATGCFPDPEFNSMGVAQGFANPVNGSYSMDNIMEVGDFNNDGIQDVVVTGTASRGVSVAMGATDGDFGFPTLYDAGTGFDLRPLSLTVADLDQDGILDIAMIGSNYSGNIIGFASWLKGKGDGTFAAAQSISQIVNSCTNPVSLSAIDLDQDGRPELSVLCANPGQVYVSRRNSSGTWVVNTGTALIPSPINNGVSHRWGRIVTGTATGFDLAVGYGDGNSQPLRLLTGITLNLTNASTGAISISAANTLPSINFFGYSNNIQIADLNMDGYGDIIIPMSHMDRGYVWHNAFGTCTATISSGALSGCNFQGWGTSGWNPQDVVVGDVDEDGRPDLFVSYRHARLIYRAIERVLNLSW